MRLSYESYSAVGDIIQSLSTLLFGSDTSPETPDMGNEYWVLWDDEGEPAGFCTVRPLLRTSFEPNWESTVILNQAGILPHARGRGLQRRMVRQRLQWARANEFTRAVSYVDLDRIASQRNLVRSGFLPYRPEYLWAGDDVVYFERLI